MQRNELRRSGDFSRTDASFGGGSTVSGNGHSDDQEREGERHPVDALPSPASSLRPGGQMP